MVLRMVGLITQLRHALRELSIADNVFSMSTWVPGGVERLTGCRGSDVDRVGCSSSENAFPCDDKWSRSSASPSSPVVSEPKRSRSCSR